VEKTKTICVYGSLRKGAYNFNRFVEIFGEDNIKYLKTKEITGFKLYSLGPYPGIKQTDNESDKLTIDLLHVTNEVYDAIYNMEIGAGYKAVETPDGIIYVYRYNVRENDLVKSGDWLKK